MNKLERRAEITRKTNETDIRVSFGLDGKGEGTVNTGIGFFDHMLELFKKHGFFSLNINAIGDLQVDAHHTVEDVGIVLGMALKEALGDKKGIRRYGSCHLPMDEALAMTVVDLSGRPYLVFDSVFTGEKAGDMETELIEEFFRAVAFNAAVTVHIKVLYGSNNHHIVEAIFKSFARALSEAVSKDERVGDNGLLSTKGTL